MASRSRRPKFTQAEINQQLQQLFLFSSLSNSSSSDPSSSSSEDLDQLGPILINIHKSNQQDSYLRALKTFVKDKEKEIEELCSRNYQDFVGSVSALLRVRQGTVSLKHRVIELNEDVQKSGGKVADKVKRPHSLPSISFNDMLIEIRMRCL